MGRLVLRVPRKPFSAAPVTCGSMGRTSGPRTLLAESTAGTLDWHCSHGFPTIRDSGHVRQHAATFSCFTH
eukprot:9245969-Lingulodinium_polyedra.AAC.1